MAKMLRVRFLQGVAGLVKSFNEDDEVDLPEHEARVWADGVRAEPIGWENNMNSEDKTKQDQPQQPAEPETAAAATDAVETASSQPRMPETAMRSAAPETTAARTKRPAGR